MFVWSPDRRVAHVREVRHLCALADVGVLHLHKGTRLGAVAQPGPRTEVRVRADLGAGCDECVHRHRALDVRLAADAGVCERAVRTDDRPVLDARTPVQLDVGADDDVAEGHVDVEPRARRIDHGHAVPHGRGDQPVSQDATGLGELRPVVDAEDLARIVGADGNDPLTVPAENGEHVGGIPSPWTLSVPSCDSTP